MRRKGDLPTKVCAGCGRPFAWRKKWEKVWEEVRFCSDRCRTEEEVRFCSDRCRTEQKRGQRSSG